MKRTLEEIYLTLKQRPEIMDLFRVILSAPEEQRPDLISAALEMLREITQKGGRA